MKSFAIDGIFGFVVGWSLIIALAACASTQPLTWGDQRLFAIGNVTHVVIDGEPLPVIGYRPPQ